MNNQQSFDQRHEYLSCGVLVSKPCRSQGWLPEDYEDSYPVNYCMVLWAHDGEKKIQDNVKICQTLYKPTGAAKGYEIPLGHSSAPYSQMKASANEESQLCECFSMFCGTSFVGNLVIDLF